jgi:hypothetical protein
MHNLYRDATHQDLVHECRRKLLEWLTATTPITTMWPYLDEDKPAFAVKQPFALAADGRELTRKGPRARLGAGKIGSFSAADYL